MTARVLDPKIVALFRVALTAEHRADAVDMQLFAGTGEAPPEYTASIGAARHVIQEIVAHGPAALPTLEALARDPQSPTAKALLDELLRTLRR